MLIMNLNKMDYFKSSTMFYDASSKVFEFAKRLRKNMTSSETILWEALRAKKVLGLRFRRQHPINNYIADFYCHPIKLVIEVDGGIHKLKEQREYDIGRGADLSSFGIEVIRFTNEQVENELETVLDKIRQVSEKRLNEIDKSP